MIERILSAGFLLLKPVPKPGWLSKDLLPEQIVSASTCICPQFPGSYEPVNVIFGQMDHSWLCNNLERCAGENLGIKPSPTGLINSLDDAARCCEAIARPDVGAEPGPWFPSLIARA
jgi:hypothetical protein